MKNEFVTKDLYFAGILYAKGVKFLTVNRQGKLCWFVFENKSLCEDLQRQYFAKTVDVNAKEYAEALRTLKNIVFT